MKNSRKKLFIAFGVILLIIAGAIYYFYFDNPDNETTENTYDTNTMESKTHAQAIVSAHEEATDAGFAMLDQDGTAADASVAVAAVLSLVEPHFSNVLGGGTWGLYYDADQSAVTSLDGVGPTGSNASANDYRNRANSPGMHQAIVPGAWDGWMLWLQEQGELELDEILTPAIELAREGYVVSDDVETWLNRQSDFVLNNPSATAIYAPDGELVQAGDTVRNEAFADTLESLADAYQNARDQGGDHADGIQAARDYFYRGPIAEEIVRVSDEQDGYLTIDDFNSFEAEIVEPISIDYDGLEVYQNPPNSQGVTMLSGLKILEGFDLESLDPDDPDAVHLQVEAVKLAYADRYHHVADPELVDVPLTSLLSDEHAQRQRERIDQDQAMTWPIADELDTTNENLNNTTTFHIVDGEGNAAAITTSIGARFNVVGNTGMHINERMLFLAKNSGDANQLTPGYKVRHTSAPFLALRDGQPYLLGGNIGVDSQPQAQLQQFLHVTEFGLTPQEAVDRPRFISTAFPDTRHPQATNNTLQLEGAFSRSLRSQLENKGHDLRIDEGIFGNAAMIELESDGMDAAIGIDTSRNPEASGGTVPGSTD